MSQPLIFLDLPKRFIDKHRATLEKMDPARGPVFVMVLSSKLPATIWHMPDMPLMSTASEVRLAFTRRRAMRGEIAFFVIPWDEESDRLIRADIAE